tara:strand:+ start:4433 stop:5383 length:951 start_codon:yes stop_codon:yes gene_type:complete
MKKLTYLVSAIAAVFSANAYADISVSGSGGLGYVNDATGDNNLVNSAAISFAMSTTTSGGLGISASMGLSVSPTGENGSTGTGGQTLTFTTGGSTVAMGDIEIADTPGSVGGAGVSANTAENSALADLVAGGFADDDGQGVSLTTGVGAATVTVGHIWSTATTDDSNVNITDATNDATAFSVSVPVGGWTLSAGTATHNDTAESSGVSVSGAMGGGTLVVGYGTQKTPAAYAAATAAGDSNVMGASYTVALDADTTVAIGYQSKKDQDNDERTRIDASASRSLGGGASVYVDMRSLTSSTATQAGTAFGFGTSVSF